MKASRPLVATLLIAALTLATALPSYAASQPQAPTAGELAFFHAVGNFKLTNGLLERNHALALDLARNPCAHGNPMEGLLLAGEVAKGRLTLDQAVAQFGAQPGMRALLAKHGLTARQAFVGGFAIMSAKMGVMPTPGATETTSGRSTPIMRENDAFIQAHRAEIQAFDQKMGALASKQAQASGGKLTACQRQIFQGGHVLHGQQ